MNNETKLTAQDLALYLGCEVEWLGERGCNLAGINTADQSFYPVGLIYSNGITVWTQERAVKPILRPLSDMTEDEEKEFVPLCAGSQIARFSRDISGPKNWKRWSIEFENGDTDSLIMNEAGETWLASYFQGSDERRNWRNIVNQHKQTDWLRMHRFDTENWIAAGLAIDKTKIETK